MNESQIIAYGFIAILAVAAYGIGMALYFSRRK